MKRATVVIDPKNGPTKPLISYTQDGMQALYARLRSGIITIKDNGRLFFFILLLLSIAIIILLAFTSSWTWQILQPDHCPVPVCNVNLTCPVPICNGTVTANLTCPVPVFNGTVDFNGTVNSNVTFNGTINSNVTFNGTIDFTGNVTCPPPVCNETIINNVTCPVPVFNGTVDFTGNVTCPPPVCNETIINNVTCPVPVFNGTVDFTGNLTCPTPVCNETILNNVTCPVPVFNGTVEFNGTVTCPTPEFNGTVYFNGTVVAGNGTCVVNTTCNCPVPVFNGTVDFNGTVVCPVPVFNGTVEFNGTVHANLTCPTPVVNVTINGTSNLIRNNTACGAAITKFLLDKPCAVPLYDPTNHVCVTGDAAGFFEPDLTPCALDHACYDQTVATPKCKGGLCEGFCRGICFNVTENPGFYICPNITELLVRGKPIFLSRNINVATSCILWGDSATGNLINGPVTNSPFYYANVETAFADYNNASTSLNYGNCQYSVTVTKEINSISYANINETYAEIVQFCYDFLGQPNRARPYPPQFPTDYLPCLDVVDAKARTNTISTTSPYRVELIYTCDYMFKCSQRRSDNFGLLLL